MNIGDTIEDFEAPDQTGAPVRLTTLLERGPVVLFFYPRALTPGCTKESCHFRDLAAEFTAAGAQRVGISADDVERQARFAGKHSFDFPLLSDTDRTIARAFGVRRPGPLFNRRTTFVIDTDRTLLDVIHSEIDMGKHADRALLVVRARTQRRVVKVDDAPGAAEIVKLEETSERDRAEP